MRDLIIGCSSGYTWDTLRYWVNSINKSGFVGDKVLIAASADVETQQIVSQNDFGILYLQRNEKGDAINPSPLAIHVERFFHIYNYLRLNPGRYRYVITTDVKDVVLQRNPVDFIKNFEDCNLFFSSESLRYRDESWGLQNITETFGPHFRDLLVDEEIFNVGILAGKANFIEHLCMNIFLMGINRPIPITDQAVFNMIIQNPLYGTHALRCGGDSDWACNLGTTMDPQKIERFKPNLLHPLPIHRDGVVYNYMMSEYHIVHQYDRVPELKALVEEKFSDV